MYQFRRICTEVNQSTKVGASKYPFWRVFFRLFLTSIRLIAKPKTFPHHRLKDAQHFSKTRWSRKSFCRDRISTGPASVSSFAVSSSVTQHCANSHNHEDFPVVPRAYITPAPSRLAGLLIGNDETAINVASTEIYVELPRTVLLNCFVKADGKGAIAFVDSSVNCSGTAPAYSNSLTKTLVSGIPTRIIQIDSKDPSL